MEWFILITKMLRAFSKLAAALAELIRAIKE